VKALFDTNILLDILVPNEAFYEASARALQDAAGEGSLVISDIVYAELCIQFETQRECDAFLEDTEIRVQALIAYKEFLATYRDARVSWQHGGRVLFPDKRIRRDREKFVPIVRSQGAQRNKLSSQGWLELKIAIGHRNVQAIIELASTPASAHANAPNAGIAF
jgi:predicted nucleic acid-binding protein